MATIRYGVEEGIPYSEFSVSGIGAIKYADSSEIIVMTNKHDATITVAQAREATAAFSAWLNTLKEND